MEYDLLFIYFNINIVYNILGYLSSTIFASPVISLSLMTLMVKSIIIRATTIIYIERGNIAIIDF